MRYYWLCATCVDVDKYHLMYAPGCVPREGLHVVNAESLKEAVQELARRHDGWVRYIGVGGEWLSFEDARRRAGVDMEAEMLALVESGVLDGT